MTGSLGRRYAKALFGLARDSQTLEAVAAEVDQLAAITNDPGIHTVLNNPMLAPSQRREIANLIIKQAKPSDVTARFIQLLADQQRIGELASISREFNRLLDQHLARVRVIVRSPTPLTDDQRNQILTTFGGLTGKKIMAIFETDPALLGGVVVEVAGKVYDGSIKTQLERLAKQLSGTAH